MYLTQFELEKSLHLKIGAKVIKKININKLNCRIMEEFITSEHFAMLLNSLAIIMNSITLILISKNL